MHRVVLERVDPLHRGVADERRTAAAALVHLGRDAVRVPRGARVANAAGERGNRIGIDEAEAGRDGRAAALEPLPSLLTSADAAGVDVDRRELGEARIEPGALESGRLRARSRNVA